MYYYFFDIVAMVSRRRDVEWTWDAKVIGGLAAEARYQGGDVILMTQWGSNHIGGRRDLSR
jgi:hypothetical protein